MTQLALDIRRLILIFFFLTLPSNFNGSLVSFMLLKTVQMCLFISNINKTALCTFSSALCAFEMIKSTPQDPSTPIGQIKGRSTSIGKHPRFAAF